MDLSFVIGELRTELESIDQAIVSLEKLADIRRRRTSGEDAEEASVASGKRTTKPKRVGASSNREADS